ncbi:hypothetical protein KK141_10460 [Dyella sp. LX-66]|uniref:hypothetical protein n=1 Tax=unclassified Dyella TaxID=2634549 RepID=UPI001BE0A9E5|nr:MULTISPECIES: hypothetical protein [unclassified Dyella]MBT2116968.1 hypothetical protein [Dyella sp. LX-1]MBT2139956.1 hypothetical protein [Dyella sp. LX-66]
MSERSTTAYRRLFEVRLLHHYWLDDGGQRFDTLSADMQAARLLGYDVRPLLRVAPTPSTLKQLGGLRCLFLATAQGFVVAAPSEATFDAAATFSFAVSLAGGDCLDYTALTFRAQAIQSAADPADLSPTRVVYRYKADVPVLSNLTGAKRDFGAGKVLFLSRDYPAPAASDAVEAMVLSGGALLQLTSDNPGAATQQLGASAADLPVFLHQGDVPAITPPAGVAGAPARGVQLGDEVPDDVFALITLTAVRASDDDFSFVDGTGAPKAPATVYEVRLKNRSTWWTYLDKRTGALSAAEPQPLPLTFYGNAGTRQKPSRGIVKAQMSGVRVTQLVSEIYI